MMKIITHAGRAHLDDLVSCALALVDAIWTEREYAAGEGEDSSIETAIRCVTGNAVIERRDPTREELEDPWVRVLDVGGRYEPSKGNFDHHQLPRGSRDSAMTLLAASLEMPGGAFGGGYEPGNEQFPVDSVAEAMERLFPWFRRRAELDSCGPFATAKAAGTEWATVAQFFGPCEQLVLDAFEREPARVAGLLADMIAKKLDALLEVESEVKYDRPWWADGRFTIADFTACDPAKAEAVSDAITAKVSGVAVFHDNRGPGLTLLRLRDDPRIDFAKVKDDIEVAFAHQGGFIAKTKSKDLEKAWRLIEGAYLAN